MKKKTKLQRKAKPPFDPKTFLAKADGGRTISTYKRNQIVFSQGAPADSVFYIQEGKVKVTVLSEQGKEAVVAVLGPDGSGKTGLGTNIAKAASYINEISKHVGVTYGMVRSDHRPRCW